MAYSQVQLRITSKIKQRMAEMVRDGAHLLTMGRDLPMSWHELVKQAEIEIDRVTTAINLKQIYRYSNTQKQQIVSYPNELEFETLHPPRHKADLAIRRCRWRDIYSCFLVPSHNRQLIERTLPFIQFIIYNTTLDYITTCNISLAAILFGEKWWRRWISIGCFTDSDITRISKLMSTISDKIKTTGCNIGYSFEMLENKCLTGYRQKPFPGFEPLKAAQELAESGIDHYWSNNEEDFKTFVFEQLYKLPKRWNKRMTFLQYIASNAWARSGSSSFGKLSLNITDRDGNDISEEVKISKNLVSDILTPEEIRQMCLESEEQINVAFDKPELGKIRIAVSSDIFTYIKMCYIYYCASDFYLEWEGVVSAESIEEETDRNIETLRKLREAFGMPFDYDQFDHQPRLIELMTIDSVGHAVGRLNTDDIQEFDIISANLMRGWKKATLRLTVNNILHIFKVRGGLESGLLLTAILGNGWNRIATKLNALSVDQILHSGEAACWIKGDDSSFVDKSALKLQLMELGYRAMDIKGGKGKFSIVQHKTEFLRVWYAKKCSGYPMRALPGIFQRKPWSNEPWTPIAANTAIASTVNTIIRRGADRNLASIFRKHTLESWGRRKGIPIAAVGIPIQLGGLGLLPWDGTTSIFPKIPTFTTDYFRDNIQINNKLIN